MTRNHDFKAHVRARMARTGESYATARRHLIGDATSAGDSPAPRSPRRPVLVLVARGHVDVHGESGVGLRTGFSASGPVGLDLAHTRMHSRASRRGEPTLPERLDDRGIGLAGSQSIESIEVYDDEVTVVGDGHLSVQLAAPFDLVIEADGHVFVSHCDGRAEITTPDGHVRLHGTFASVDVETGDGHVVVDAAASGLIRTGDGHVTLGLLSADVSVEIRADKVIADSSIRCTGGSGTWLAVAGTGLNDQFSVETSGRVELFGAER